MRFALPWKKNNKVMAHQSEKKLKILEKYLQTGKKNETWMDRKVLCGWGLHMMDRCRECVWESGSMVYGL
ncbi:hypothetical protein L195_g013898 [Trifolium pratense]|uniref:Uncharacterized protein n=1 Tax=Trifolium pratense TaxID=57577 RepID=A0A2K3PEK2_TRIPR|nr:hypothetical protein L195_g010391 [Trifolium pratense]PNY17160.1 hypothetical protein L195_g013898 [Trifolium pratense]